MIIFTFICFGSVVGILGIAVGFIFGVASMMRREKTKGPIRGDSHE